MRKSNNNILNIENAESDASLHEHSHADKCNCEHEHDHDHCHDDDCHCGHKHEHDHDHGHNDCGCGHEHSHDHDHEHGHSHSHDHGCGVGCSCGCDHHHGDGDEAEERRKSLIIIGVSLALLVTGLLLPENPAWLRIAVFAAGYLVSGGEVLLGAVRNLLRGHLLAEDFLMAIASLGAFAVGEYPEAIAVMVLFRIGELFEEYAEERSRRSVEELMSLRPDHATVLRDGREMRVDPEEVLVGETIVVGVGERIPLDGIVTDGESFLDTSALTGESVPRRIVVGEQAVSGCISTNGRLMLRVTHSAEDSSLQKILDMVEHASDRKSQPETLIRRFARYYTPIVVALAVLVAIIPPLFFDGEFRTWIYRALTFLVVSCPCALVISVPLSFFGGIGGASRAGILVKGGSYLELLANASALACDKTGTLTEGVFEVQEIIPFAMSETEVLRYAAAAESGSTHPIATSIMKAYASIADGSDHSALRSRTSSVREHAGKGVSVRFEGHEIAVGSLSLPAVSEAFAGHSDRVFSQDGTLAYVVVDGQAAGIIRIADRVKTNAAEALRALRDLGIQQSVLLTGDRREVGETVAAELGMSAAYTELLPGDKISRLSELLDAPDRRGSVLFVGDGINDAPVLAAADVGIAMGGLGSDAAIEAADVVIMNDDLAKLPIAVRIARKTVRIARENILFSLGVKFAVLALAALGLAGMWMAVFADVGVCILAILNALRTLRYE